jgi:hypothetical protein
MTISWYDALSLSSNFKDRCLQSILISACFIDKANSSWLRINMSILKGRDRSQLDWRFSKFVGAVHVPAIFFTTYNEEKKAEKVDLTCFDA